VGLAKRKPANLAHPYRVVSKDITCLEGGTDAHTRGWRVYATRRWVTRTHCPLAALLVDDPGRLPGPVLGPVGPTSEPP